MEHGGVHGKRDARLGMSKALADGNNIDVAGNQLRGVGVPQSMKRNLGHAKALSYIAPIGSLGRSGPPSRLANSRSSDASLPCPSNSRVSKSCLRCSRSASRAISGRVMSRRPALVFADLKRIP